MDKQENSLKIIAVLVLIASFSAALLAYVNKITRGPIARNMKLETLQAVKIVLKPLGKINYPEEALSKKMEGFEGRYFPANALDSETLMVQ